MGVLAAINQWFRRTGREVEDVAGSVEPDANPAAGSLGDPDRETSTNAQVQGASDEPWPGNQ